jgi:hypothetical protein
MRVRKMKIKALIRRLSKYKDNLDVKIHLRDDNTNAKIHSVEVWGVINRGYTVMIHVEKDK